MATARKTACSKAEAAQRAKTARAYLDVAELVLEDAQRHELLNVSSGLSVLAGIAASDAICCIRLGRRHRGDDHRGAADLLRGAVSDGPALAQQLLRLLDLKDAAHYGVAVVSDRRARDALKWGNALVARAVLEVER